MAEESNKRISLERIRGLLPRRDVMTGAVQKVRDEISGATVLKSASIGAVVGLGITAAMGIATGNFVPSALDFSVVGGSAALGVAHGVVHGLLENATDGAKEAIQHNRTCDQIENALCENPELLQQAAIDKAASYQFDQEPAPSRTAKTIIQQAEARRAGAGELLASQSPAPSGARGL